jgi:hypothetical protein
MWSGQLFFILEKLVSILESTIHAEGLSEVLSELTATLNKHTGEWMQKS